MALTKKGHFDYGDEQADIREELEGYSLSNKDMATQFADAVCTCGGCIFQLLLDEEAGVAIRICKACDSRHAMCDSEDYVAGTTPEECECLCGGNDFEVTIGVSLYADSEDVRWLYVGLRCIQCSLTACYGDWKNEYIGYRGLLDNV